MIQTGPSREKARGSLLARSLWGVSVLLTLVGLLMTLVAEMTGPDNLVSALYIVTGGLGMIIAIRMPSNPVGWLLLATGLIAGLRVMATGYADLSLLAGVGSESIGIGMALASYLLWAPTIFIPLILVLLFFPDGKLPSPRWRWVTWAAVVGMVGTALFSILVEDVEGANLRWKLPENPLAPGLPEDLFTFFWLLVPVSLVAAAVSLFVRIRHATGDQRQQIKWVVYGGSLGVLLWMIGGQAFDETTLGGILTSTAVTLVPVSIGVAILRYRLYEIDRLVSRTVTYTLVAGLLAGVFAVIAVGLPLWVGVPKNNPVLVALATMAAAALFNPVRHRVQAWVDRRFNRSRYDAHQEVDSFAEHVHSDLELDDIASELTGVVAKTMQPSAASVWIKSEP